MKIFCIFMALLLISTTSEKVNAVILKSVDLKPINTNRGRVPYSDFRLQNSMKLEGINLGPITHGTELYVVDPRNIQNSHNVIVAEPLSSDDFSLFAHSGLMTGYENVPIPRRRHIITFEFDGDVDELSFDIPKMKILEFLGRNKFSLPPWLIEIAHESVDANSTERFEVVKAFAKQINLTESERQHVIVSGKTVKKFNRMRFISRPYEPTMGYPDTDVSGPVWGNMQINYTEAPTQQ